MKELNLNGAVVQAYPLTAAQRIHYYTVSACHREELLNIATGFYIQYDAIDFETLRECIYDGYQKFESMRLRLAPDEDGNMVQYLVPTEDREIKIDLKPPALRRLGLSRYRVDACFKTEQNPGTRGSRVVCVL